jgi:hypothetical protein
VERLRIASACASPAPVVRAAPVAAISGKPPASLSSSGLPNASAAKSTPDWSISRYGSTTRSARAKHARSTAPWTKRSRKRTFGGAAACSGAVSMRGMPTIHSSASSIPRHASSSTSRPL